MRNRLLRNMRGLLITALVSALAMVPAAYAKESDQLTQPEVVESEFDWFQFGITTLDVAVIRPTGVLATLGGFAMFVASLPFVGPAGQIETTWDIFVYNSYDHAFVRPIGE